MKAGLRRDQQVPVSSGMSIRMFPLTPEGDWTAAVSECVWVGGGQELMDRLHQVTDGVFPGQGHRKCEVH